MCILCTFLITEKPKADLPFIRAHSIFIFFCSNMKYFPFNGKYRENLKCCDELRRLLLDYWHNFQYMWKATHFPVKQKYLLTQTGDVMQNKMWRRLIKSTNKRRIQLSIFSVVLSFIKFSVK